MSDNNRFRGDTRDKAWIPLMVLLQEIHVARVLRQSGVEPVIS